MPLLHKKVPKQNAVKMGQRVIQAICRVKAGWCLVIAVVCEFVVLFGVSSGKTAELR